MLFSVTFHISSYIRVIDRILESIYIKFIPRITRELQRILPHASDLVVEDRRPSLTFNFKVTHYFA